MRQKEEENRKDRREALNGWRKVRLREVIRDAQGGFACGERKANGVIQLRMNNVTVRGQFEWSSFIRVPADSDTIAEYRLQSGDVLFNNTNSTELVGKTALFKGHEEPVVFSNHFTRLRTDPDQLLPAFLAFWLQTQWQNGLFEKICNRWIGQSAVQREKLLALDISLPPLSEQKRIAAILSEQMAAVERARAAAETQLEAAKKLPAAYLRAVFESPEARKWPRKRLDTVCNIQLGKMLSPKSKTGIRPRPYLRNANVQWNRFDLTEILEMDFSSAEEEKFALKPGDLLVCEGGEPGRAAVWQGQITPCFYQKALHRLRPTNEAIDPYFLLYRLWFGTFRAEFSDSHAKTTIAHLPAVRLGTLLVGAPPLVDQRQIVAILDKQLAEAKAVSETLEAQLGIINKLPAVLLRQAFAGRL